MERNKSAAKLRALVLVTTPKMRERVVRLFEESGTPMHYAANGVGTAPSEMMDILGLGSTEKCITISLLSQLEAQDMMKKMRKELKIGTVNSGIAFTTPITSASKIVISILNKNEDGMNEKEGLSMPENKYALIAAIVNQGYTENLMNAARSVGAGGGTVIHTHCVGGALDAGVFGFGVDGEKEIVLIVANTEDKVAIMQAISNECGIKTDAKGIVVSLPIESVIGLDD